MSIKLNLLEGELRQQVEEALNNARMGAEEELQNIQEKPKKERKKRGASEYNTFFKEHYKKVKEDNPEIKFSEASKIVSKAWKQKKNPEVPEVPEVPKRKKRKTKRKD